jgi:hypothetical protein
MFQWLRDHFYSLSYIAVKDHVLIIEDKLMAQGRLAFHLRNEGYAVYVASTGFAFPP